jgi:putative ABC transport system substrate-binding protein
MIQRRSLIATGALCLAPLAAWAQPTRKVHRIGMLGVGATNADMMGPRPKAPASAALLDGLRDLGYVHGEHFVTEPRSAEGQIERFHRLVAELIELQVDVVVAAGPALAALKRATTSLPVVMAGAEDPVGLGVVRSLARPGTNFTGLSNQGVEATIKKLQLLKEMIPGAAPVAMLWDPGALLSWQAAEAAARQRGWKLLSFVVRDAAEIEAAIQAASAAGAGSVLPAGGLAFRHARRIAELTAGSRLPAFYVNAAQVGDAGLISYAADLSIIWRRAAVFVDKILRGAKPADLAVEQPTKFNLIINLKTARAIGLKIPQSLLLRADEVIE